MLDHAIFGGCLRSDVPFPELRPLHAQAPSWTLTTHASSPPPHALSLMGEEAVTAEARVRLYAHAGGYRLEYDDTGAFDVSAAGQAIAWYPGDRADAESARIDVMGRVLAVAQHAAGRLTLHGSAVALGDGSGAECIAFLAPKRRGKSTLALALANAGGRLLTDDTLPVDPGPPPMAWPGVHSVRLWADSLGAVGDGAHTRASPLTDKATLDAIPAHRLMTERGTLAAAYLLMPVAAAAGRPPASRRRLAPVESALALVQHAKIGALLRGPAAATLLDRAVAVANQVPVHVLEVVRDFEQLPAVVEQLLDWHARPVTA